MQVNELVIEVGRKCNAKCKHCLRGPAENVMVDVQKAKKLIDSFESISMITFTGGEPALYGKEIAEIIDYIISEKKDVHGFYVASNGMIFNQELMFSLCRLYAYIETFTEEAAYTCYFDLSIDQFHDKLDNYTLSLFKAFSFVTHRGNIDKDYIIDEGNATINHIGKRQINKQCSFDFQDNIVEMVYLNAEGYLLPECDFSYKSQREAHPFKFQELPLKTIFETYNVA